MKNSVNCAKQFISHAANQSVRPYSSNQEYLYAMREDLADWLKGLYAVDINVTNFFDVLATGTLLCQHANNITTCAAYLKSTQMGNQSMFLPQRILLYNKGRYVRASSFFARDNVASFIGWCRSELHIPESVMFETNDLVLRVNEKNVILCLLEVARQGSKFGVPAPVLIQMEQDIDKEIEFEKEAKLKQKHGDQTAKQPVAQKVSCDFKSLDEMVQYILGMCTCPSQFPMVKVSDGKYKVGDSESLIFMRILRQHVMVRVGGGWDTLEHYLDKHDPCRCQRHRGDKTLSPRHSRSLSNNPPSQVPEKSHQKAKKMSDSQTESSRSKDSKRLSASGRSTPQLGGAHNITKTTPQNVFKRLSRPKSTPPIPSKQSVQQDDLLLVQRNKTGSHFVQRPVQVKTYLAENKKVSESSHHVHQNRLRNRPATSSTDDASSLRNRNMNLRHTIATAPIRKHNTSQESMTKLQHEKKGASNMHIGQQAANHHYLLNKHPNAENEPIVVPTKRELEMLREFEKECIKNQAAITDGDVSEIDEDYEVALHMQEHKFLDRDEKPVVSHTHSKPRKDKMEQHDRKTKIPTPVSFMKPLLSSRSFDSSRHKVVGDQHDSRCSLGLGHSQQRQSEPHDNFDTLHSRHYEMHGRSLEMHVSYKGGADKHVETTPCNKSLTDIDFYTISTNTHAPDNMLVTNNPLRGPQWV